MLRKRKNPSPDFRMGMPFNPFSGQPAGLPGEPDISRFGLFQVIVADTHDNYVTCRGFDPEIGVYFNSIPVAKPYGRRGKQNYKLAEVLCCGTVRTMRPKPDPGPGYGENAAKAAVSVGNPASLSEELEWLEDNDNTPIRWIHLGDQGQVVRAAELRETMKPNRVGDEKKTDAILLQWDGDESNYVATDVEIFVYERLSAYAGFTGDIVFINSENVVIGGPYPILTGELLEEFSTDGGTAKTRPIDSLAHFFEIDARDRTLIMNPQVQPSVDPLELRTHAEKEDKLQIRWNKHTEEWDIVTLGGICATGTGTTMPPCTCAPLCQDQQDESMYNTFCEWQCDPDGAGWILVNEFFNGTTNRNACGAWCLHCHCEPPHDPPCEPEYVTVTSCTMQIGPSPSQSTCDIEDIPSYQDHECWQTPPP